MIHKKIAFIFFASILLMSFGIYFYSTISNDKDLSSNEGENTELHKESTHSIENGNSNTLAHVKENQYNIIYIKSEKGTGSSFVPLELNPGLKNNSDYHVSISFDDNGDIINDEKIIVIHNYSLSKENKEAIRAIAGEENYNDALKEIEKRVNETKESLEEEGLI